MITRSIWSAAILSAMFTATVPMFGADPPDSNVRFSLNLFEAKQSDLRPIIAVPSADTTPSVQKSKSQLHFSKTRFLIFSAAVYGAAITDMHQTLGVRRLSWWYETDPLARPFVRLPSPAYYATGLAMVTGINWLSWRMGHSRRWHKLAPIPQLLTIAGNLHAFQTNRY